jgi:hypothetical protein
MLALALARTRAHCLEPTSQLRALTIVGASRSATAPGRRRYFNVFDAAPENERQSAIAADKASAAGGGAGVVNEFFT